MLDIFLTKSKYVDYMTCMNRGWLDLNKKSEKIEEDLSENPIVQGGVEAGILARGLFGPYTLIDNGSGESVDILIQRTNEAILQGDNVICEATFRYQHNLCKVDILKRNDDGTYSIYEVKGTTNPYKGSKRFELEDKYLNDIAYQYYVLKKSGIDVSHCYIVYLNNQYIYDGTYNLNALFNVGDVTDSILIESENVESNIQQLNTIALKSEEPIITFASNKCKECPYNKHCYEVMGVPEENSVLGLYNDRKKYSYLNEGIKSFEDLINNKIPLSIFNERMVDFRLNNKEPFVNKRELNYFLNQFRYPLYFFDFETYQCAIPKVIGTRPYQQIPFQYSLHIMYEDGRIVHKEYLASNYEEPRIDLIHQMLTDLECEGTIIAYNDSFEKSRIKELARDFDEYRIPLYNLLDRFMDLADVFEKGMYYKKEMSRTSIKDVLPSLFPDDPTLDYHNLEDVHKGDEASNAFMLLPSLDVSTRNKLRESLLKYCCLDTFAMVKIYNLLIKLGE